MSISEAVSNVTQRSSLSTARLQLLWVTFANAAITALNVVIGLLLARHFSQNDYGQLSYFINVFGTLRLLSALGMTGQVSFEIACARGRGEPIANYFYSLLGIRVVTITGLTVLAVGLGFMRGDSLFMIAGLASMLALLNDFAVGALQGLDLIRHVIAVLALQPVLYALGAVAVLMRGLPVSAIYLSLTISFAPAILLAVILLVRSLDLPDLNNLRLPGLWSSVRYAGGMYLLAILGTIFTSYATLYLGLVGRFRDAALITVPLNLIFTPGLIVGAAMTTFYFPRISALTAGKHDREAQSLFTLFYGLVSAFTILVAVSLLLYPHVVLSFLYGNRYQDSAPLLALVAPVTYLYTVQTVLIFTIAAQGRIRSSIPGALVSAIALIGAITLSSGIPGNLTWFAIAHGFAATLGLAWQLWLVGYELRASLVRTSKQIMVAIGMVGAARLIISDTPDQTPEAVVVLGLITMIYAVWVWRETGVKG
jgi:O-antigen/teichoic acid export membrane protein